MNFYCEDCKIPNQSYDGWVNHLATPQHQLIAASKIKQWVSEMNPGCLVMISIFTTKDPLEVATKFSKFGFLWNFYVHNDHKFFIIQYDTKQTAGFALRKINEGYDLSWKVQIHQLTDLNSEDWVTFFPPAAAASFPASTQPQLLPATYVMPATYVIRCAVAAVGESPPIKIPRLDPNPTQNCSSSSHPDTTQDFNNYFRRKPQNIGALPSQSNLSSLDNLSSTHSRTSNFIALPANSDSNNLSCIAATNILPNPAFKIATNLSDQNQIPSTSFSAADINFCNQAKVLYDNQTHLTHQDKRSHPIKIVEESLQSHLTVEQTNLMKTGIPWLDEQVDRFFKTTLISLKDLERIKRELLPTLSELLQQFYPGCNLYLMDNFQGGVGNSNMNIEINVAGIGSQELEVDLKNWSGPSEQRELRHAQKCKLLVTDLYQNLQAEMKKLGANIYKLCYAVELQIINFGQNSHVKFRNPILPKHKFLLTTCVSEEQYSRRRHFKLIDFFIQLYPNLVRSFLCIIHYWSQQNGFMQLELQYIKDYALSIMCIIFLQMKGLLPTLQQIQFCAKGLKIDNFIQSISLETEILDNKEICNKLVQKIRQDFTPSNEIYVLELVKEYFEFYGRGDFLPDIVICTWTADFVPRSTFMLSPKTFPPCLDEYKKYVESNPMKTVDTMGRSRPLYIQNIFEPTLNIGYSSLQNVFKQITAGYRLTTSKLFTLLHGESQENNTIMSIFEPIGQEEFLPEISKCTKLFPNFYRKRGKRGGKRGNKAQAAHSQVQLKQRYFSI